MFVWVLEGKAADPRDIGRRLVGWTEDFGATAGYLGATGGVTDDGRFLLLVSWESEEAGNELLMRVEQQQWYEAFQSCFDGPIAFVETGDATTFLDGRSDAVGFVQAIKVAGVDRQRIEDVAHEFEALAGDVRPDLIGGVRVWTAPDSFIEANHFTSEQEARAAERQAPPPQLAPRLEEWMAMIGDAEYFDLTEPFVHRAGGR